MKKAITAIYRTHHTATLVRDEIAGLGIPSGYVHVIPDTAERPAAGEYRDVDTFNRDLHHLHLPEDDVRIYQQAVRNGDYVVSVDIDDDAHIDRVKQIMRRPEESYDIDALRQDYGSADYVPYRDEGAAYNESQRGIYDPAITPAGEPGYVRGYSRQEPLRRRNETLGGGI